MEQAGKTVRTSVRALVEFILRSGDLDNRRSGMADREAMAEGSRIHRKIQQRRGAGYTPEVPLRYERAWPGYTLVIEGRADGICVVSPGASAGVWNGAEEVPAPVEAGAVLIEEIKGVYADLTRIEEPVPVHLAQAMCYACIYGQQHELTDIWISMTYVSIETEREKKFVRSYSLRELTDWFEELLEAWHKWAGFQVEWEKNRNASMRQLEFPFAYRPGQRELVADIYRTILRKKQLFVQAPTGIGKTMSAVFPSVRAIGEGFGEKIFYLTAKTVTRTVAEEAFSLLRGCGLQFKSLTITSKEKSCVLDEPDCNPAACPRAKGHFDRVNQAIWQMLTEETEYTRETILRHAEAWNVCPFEMQLDLSWFCDAVICDYNYVFDPTARLKRFFGETGRKGDWIFLIDEAHNLVERGRDMYSAGLYREDFRDARSAAGEELAHVEELLQTGGGGKKRRRKKELRPDEGQLSLFPDAAGDSPGAEEDADAGFPQPALLRGGERKKAEELRQSLLRFRKAAGRCAGVLLQYRKEHEAAREETAHAGGQGQASAALQERESIEEFALSLLNMAGVLEEVLADMRDCETRHSLLSFYFSVCSFLDMYELLDENYIIYTEITREDRFFLKLFCVSPAVNLQACLDRGRSAVFYSATLLPVKYYQNLLSGRTDDYAVYFRSPFDPARRLLLIGRDVSSRYTRRTRDEYVRFAAYIRGTAAARPGRYLVFFPSYRMLQDVYEVFAEAAAGDGVRCLCQAPSMNEEERERFLAAFQEEAAEETLIGFCVMGGIFSEGIDLYGDRLIGAIVIGTGLPQIGEERELLRRFYDRNGQNGFDYAYRFPGMNKVQQAAGRVIRTTEDTGVILLLDERFAYPENRQLFPAEWADARPCTLRNLPDMLRRFWNP